jgi:hypothetical protein
MGDLLLGSQLSRLRVRLFDEDQTLSAFGQFDPAQCEYSRFGVAVHTKSRREVTMSTQLSDTDAAVTAPAAMPVETPMSKVNQRAANFTLGARKLIFEELQFASNEFWERTQTEMHLFSEFVSKVAGVRSVSDMQALYAECSKHQIEFVRRDFDRVFKHGEWMIEATSNLFKSRPD